jgi:hypothetical protein
VTVTQFDEHLFHESDEENMLKSGKRWLGDKMTGFSNVKTNNFSLPNLVTSSTGSNNFFDRCENQLWVKHSGKCQRPVFVYPYREWD